MGALLLAVLGGIAAQGHANVSDFPSLEVATQLVHLVSVAIWIVGLAMVALVHLRLPRLAPEAGRRLASKVLARFSRVALVAVAVAVLTGVIRSLGELSDPAELWETSFGQSILIKLALLFPIAALALSNRRSSSPCGGCGAPTATLRLVRRLAGAELLLSLAIVVVASVLVAQVPGAS